MERSAYITTGIHFLVLSPSFPSPYSPSLMLYLYFINFSAFDRKPFSFNKPLTPPSTPASPFGSSTSTATHHVQKRAMPPAQTQTQGLPLLPVHNHSSTPPHQTAQTPLHSQSPPFAVPCPPVNHPDASYSTDHRYEYMTSCNLLLGCFSLRHIKAIFWVTVFDF